MTLGNLQGVRAHQVNTIVLLGRWSGKGHLSVTLEKTVICMFIVWSLGTQSTMHQYDIFMQKKILQRPFISDTWDNSALYIHCKDFQGDNTH